MKTRWESTVTLSNALLWVLSVITCLVAAQTLAWGTHEALVATETIVMTS